MGIQGLLPLLKSIMTPFHIKELEGCFVAVDTYSWLHKGALSCSAELCKGQPTSKHIDYCMHRVNMLRHYGVKPLLVFDGGLLPMKNEQEIKRARSRKENLSRAVEHESNGNLRAAYECYQKAVDISPLVAYDLIQVLKQEHVPYVVAPYEADAQMTYLALSKQVEAVITEDSDLIAFGCPRIIYKMDKFGQGEQFKNELIQHNKELNLVGFTQMMLLEMCILSGCDYLQSLPGMGLKKAYTLMKKFKCHEKALKHLKYNSAEVTPLYEETFKKAILTFRHQRVYDPITEDIVHLVEPADALTDDLEFLGPWLPQRVAKGIAQGELDPFTQMPIQRESAAFEKVVQGTYPLKNFKPSGEKKKLDLPAQKNLLTNYFCFASLEAKRKFKAPRIAPKYPNGNTETSTDVDLHEVQNGIGNNLNFPEAHDPGLLHVRKTLDCNEIPHITKIQHSICKPCISSHKNLESEQDRDKARSGNKNVIVRSSYFMKKSCKESSKKNKSNLDENADNLQNAVKYDVCGTSTDLIEGIRGEEETDTRSNSYFQHNVKRNVSNEKDHVVGADVVEKHRSGMDTVNCRTTDNRKDRVMSSYFEQISVNESNDDPESQDGLTTEMHKHRIMERPPADNSLEFAMRKRKIDQAGMCTSDLEEETKAEEGKFGCNINHLSHYSDIAEKSIEKFVSVISSFSYNSSGSRASGLRAPLKDIKNNCMKSPTPGMDLSKYAYAPAKQKASSRWHKSKV